MFSKATRLKLRYESPKGYLTTEDLWDLPLVHLNVMAKGLNKSLKESSEVDFLQEKSEEDALIKLQFDVVLHVLDVKKTEHKARVDAAANKVKREKLLGILAEKQDDSLRNLSVDEIQKELAALS